MSKEFQKTTFSKPFEKLHIIRIGSEMFKRNCEHCKTQTMQSIQLYNPDNPDEGEVWQCSVCKENTAWVST